MRRGVDLTDGGLWIGAGEMVYRRVGVDLQLRQFTHAAANAAEPQLERRPFARCRLSKASTQPERRGNDAGAE